MTFVELPVNNYFLELVLGKKKKKFFLPEHFIQMSISKVCRLIFHKKAKKKLITLETLYNFTRHHKLFELLLISTFGILKQAKASLKGFQRIK